MVRSIAQLLLLATILVAHAGCPLSEVGDVKLRVKNDTAEATIVGVFTGRSGLELATATNWIETIPPGEYRDLPMLVAAEWYVYIYLEWDGERDRPTPLYEYQFYNERDGDFTLRQGYQVIEFNDMRNGKVETRRGEITNLRIFDGDTVHPWNYRHSITYSPQEKTGTGALR